MGDKVRQPQGQLQEWLHWQLRAAKKPQQVFGQGAARMVQKYLNQAKRPQQRPQATQEWAQAVVEPQEKTWVAAELQ